MRPPAEIRSWMSIERMFRWLQNAPDEATYKRRMAIWLTHTSRLHAPRVADILSVSVQSVHLWIRQYNLLGPKGLERTGRGGRRWAFMSPRLERQILRPFIRRLKASEEVKTSQIHRAVELFLGHPVSRSYIYRMLRRNDWQRTCEQIRARLRERAENLDFRRLIHPWRRSDTFNDHPPIY